MASDIIEKRPIGMLVIDAEKMKTLVKPSPERCLDVGILISNFGTLAVNQKCCRSGLVEQFL